jgi:rubrerythrin
MDAIVAITVDDVLEIAIAMEKLGARFYVAASKVADDPMAKELFVALARAEMHHMNFFEKLRDAVRANEATPPVPDPGGVMAKYVRSWSKNKIFDGMDPRRFVEGRGAVELVKQAIGLEQEAIDFYQGLGVFLSSKLDLKALEAVIGQERKHKEKLEGVLLVVEEATSP